MTILLTTEISGLTSPTYNSGATNKLYVDTISGNLDTKIDALGSFDAVNYITSSNSLSIFAHSTNINSRFVASGIVLFSISTQNLSGQLLSLHSSRDISNWDSTAWTNSGIIWNGSSWVAKASGSAGVVGNLSDLTIDEDKDWNAKGIHNLSYLSSNTISGGSFTTQNLVVNANTISGLAAPIYPSAATNKIYVDSLILNISGNFLPSSSTRDGWAYVADGGTVAHTCSATPTWVGIAPSGSNPISFSFKVDSTNITIYHTSPDQETFSWRCVV